MTFHERKQLRTERFNLNFGKKTGNLEELAAVRQFYKTESLEAQDAAADLAAERAYFEICGSVNKYYSSDS